MLKPKSYGGEMKSTVAETSQDWTNHRLEYYGRVTIHSQ